MRGAVKEDGGGRWTPRCCMTRSRPKDTVTMIGAQIRRVRKLAPQAAGLVLAP